MMRELHRQSENNNTTTTVPVHKKEEKTCTDKKQKIKIAKEKTPVAHPIYLPMPEKLLHVDNPYEYNTC